VSGGGGGGWLMNGASCGYSAAKYISGCYFGRRAGCGCFIHFCDDCMVLAAGSPLNSVLRNYK